MHGLCCYKLENEKQVGNEVVIQCIEISWSVNVKCEESYETVCRKKYGKVGEGILTVDPKCLLPTGETCKC